MTAKKIIVTLFAAVILSGLQAQIFTVAWQTDSVLKTPESVYYDQARNQIYVSNINGNPTGKDGNGFLSLLAPDGKIIKLRWVTGMDAPKGIAVTDSILYVTDIDKIRVVDITQAKVVKTIPVDNAEFLNDIVVGNEGNIYISDTKKNQILKLTNDTVSVWLMDEKLKSPNGLAFHKSKLIVGTEDDLLAVDPDTKNIRVKYKDVGPVDGLVPVGVKKYVLSDWAGRVILVGPSETIVLGNTTDSKIQAADLGYIPDKNLILIPTFFNNRVVARVIP